MEENHLITYLYIQPLSVSLSSTPMGHQSCFQGENCLKFETPKFFSSKNRKPPLKLRDMVKLNKEYKVYNKSIHFYNFLYEIQIKSDTFHKISSELLHVCFVNKSQSGKNTNKIYGFKLGDLVSRTQFIDHSVISKASVDELNGQQTKFHFNAAKSYTPMSLTSLESIFEEEGSHEESLVEEKLQSGFSNIESKQRLFSTIEGFSTIASSQDWGKIKKIERTNKSPEKKQSRKTPRKSIEGSLSQQISINEQSPGKQLSYSYSMENTSFYDSSPKLKRLYRLRRSCVIPLSIHCEMDEVDTSQSFFKKKLQYTNCLQSFLLGIGVVLIYLLMIPWSKV